MLVDPRDYFEVPANPHHIRAGTILLPTTTPIVAGGGTSHDFVVQEGGDDDTFIFLFGLRRVQLGVDVVEGVFLNEAGPGFRPTWGVQQLMRETSLGGWHVITTDEVLRDWTERVEARMNLGS